MSAKPWGAKLTCGHWQWDFDRAGAEHVRSVGGTRVCTVCGETATFTGQIRRGGMSAAKTEKWLASQASKGEVDGRVVHHEGLAYRDDYGQLSWWCRYCDGIEPSATARRKAKDREELGVEWAWHATSAEHRRVDT